MAVDIWLPGFEKRPIGPDGGPYDEMGHPKIGWHTWEGMSWNAAETAFRKYPPHLAVNCQDRQRRQYVALNRHAYAFRGNDNDDSYVIQIEVAGWAAHTQDMSDADCEWLMTEVVEVIERFVPVPRIIIGKGFHGADEGISPPLASTSSPIRLTVPGLDAFAGHLGHQHMPPPDVHWDPGRFPLDRIFSHATTTGPGGPDMPLSDEDVERVANRTKEMVLDVLRADEFQLSKIKDATVAPKGEYALKPQERDLLIKGTADKIAAKP